MAQGTVKETLRQLIFLQGIDEDLFACRKELKEKPAQALFLKAQYESKKARLHSLEEKAKEFELIRKAKELDLKVKEQSIVSANAQLMTLKTNKEYQAKLFEIETLRSDKSVLEDEILRMMESSEKHQTEVAREKVLLAEEEKKYQAEKDRVDAALESVRGKVAELEAKRKEATKGVDSRSLAMYERMVESRDGIALVPLIGNACGGCFMNLPSQVANRIKMFDQIVCCEMCARLLYIKEELE